MVRIPRDIHGNDLAKKLEGYGYQTTRQTGSHMRLTRHAAREEQHVTIPCHSTLRVGTLNGIVSTVAGQLERNKADLLRELFG
jgi:predicted RNA binding protein YcfA (HicA-like mRNA interferase family)